MRKQFAYTLSGLLVLAAMLMIAETSYAQFKKYESRSRFKTTEEPSAEGKKLIEEAKKVAAKENVPAAAPSTAPTAPANDSAIDMDSDDSGLFEKDDFGDDDDLAGMGSGRSGGGANLGIGADDKKSKDFVNLNPETAFGPEVITSFNFPDTDILELTKHMQKLTGINLIMDKDVKGKISIVAQGPITVGDAWKAYLTALNTNGYALVKSGAFYQIVQTRDIRYIPTKIYTGSFTPNTENYVMKILPLKYVASKEIQNSFRPFLSRYGRIYEIKQTNTILVQDTGSNINRLTKLIKFIDVPGHEESLQIIKVNNTSAQEVAGLLEKILKTGGSSGYTRPGMSSTSSGGYKIIAEPRTNSIIAMTNSEGAKQLRTLISKLDVRLESKGGGQIHVYYLRHSDAETLSKTLSSLVSNASQQAKSTTARFAGLSSNDARPLFSSEVKVTADKGNNALVVMASPTDYLTVRSIIAQLDIARDQVYVEGLIMDTKVVSGYQFGINLMGAYGSGATQKWGSTPGGAGAVMDLASNNFQSLTGMFLGLGFGAKKEVNINGTNVKVNSVNGLIKAIASDSNTNILATPQILALDNEDAIFEVGEMVPTVVKETTTTGTSTSVKNQKVTLRLKLTPQINKQSRIVKLKIDYKIDDFSEREVGSKDGVGTTTRQAVTTVLVRDKDTIVMGGLMRDKKIETEAKVPLLGDIPVLGWLFKSKKNDTEKVNMLFFLTPRILAPYETTASEATKDLLSRREKHLGTVYKDDPFNATVKGLYKKAEQQEKGPLFKDQRQLNAEAQAKKSADPFEVPDYQTIIKDAGQSNKVGPSTTLPAGDLPVSSGGHNGPIPNDNNAPLFDDGSAASELPAENPAVANEPAPPAPEVEPANNDAPADNGGE